MWLKPLGVLKEKVTLVLKRLLQFLLLSNREIWILEELSLVLTKDKSSYLPPLLWHCSPCLIQFLAESERFKSKASLWIENSVQLVFTCRCQCRPPTPDFQNNWAKSLIFPFTQVHSTPSRPARVVRALLWRRRGTPRPTSCTIGWSTWTRSPGLKVFDQA